MAVRTDEEIDEATIENDEQLAEAEERAKDIFTFAVSFRHPNPDVQAAARAGAVERGEELERAIEWWKAQRDAPRRLLAELAMWLRETAGLFPARSFSIEAGVADTNGSADADWTFNPEIACRLADLIDPPKLPTAMADEPNGEGA